jgi:oxalate decarboxylase
VQRDTGDTDLAFLEMFKADRYVDISMNKWIRRLPPKLVTLQLNIDEATIKKKPNRQSGSDRGITRMAVLKNSP